KRTIVMMVRELPDHLTYFLPYLKNPEPMVTEIAFNDCVNAPYGALRSLKPRLDAKAIRAWLHNPKLTVREPVYLLLLGVAGTSEDAEWIEQRLEFARKKHDTTNLPALIGAALELRGPAGAAQIEKLYLTDLSRTKPESEAAATALQTWRETTKPQRVAFNAK